MIQIFREAWLEWQSYTSDGKLAALLLAALLYLWFSRKHKGQEAFLLYTAVASICCILPVTAALLWIYQTRFYDYRWVWSIVPQTAVTAYGIVMLLADCWAAPKAVRLRRGLPVAALLLAAILLCGGLGRQVWDGEAETAESRQAYEVLGALREFWPDGEICLWAPKEILVYVREYDPSVKVPYGRNMWDVALNAYTFDQYDENTTKMYQWMESVAEDGNSLPGNEPSELEGSVAYALSVGVNCILLPKNAEEDVLRRVERLLDVDARQLGSYYLFVR